MKKSHTISPDNAHELALQQRGYRHYNSFNRKDTIMKYIQAGVAILIVVLVCIGLFGLDK